MSMSMLMSSVYGLGASALLEGSLRLIFSTKGRPLTDPLIVHVQVLGPRADRLPACLPGCLSA